MSGFGGAKPTVKHNKLDVLAAGRRLLTFLELIGFD